MKRFIVLGFVAATFALRIKSPTTQQNTELFNYSPNDEYTLPEDIDDDKPPVIFSGDVRQAKIVSIENKNHGQGKFKYRLQTQNGIELNQVGKLKDPNTFVISGSYSYTGADGKRYRVRYTADEFGYHPITELDVEIPDLQPASGPNNGFQFLSHKLDNDVDHKNNRNDYGGDGQIGDDYSYGRNKGYSDDVPSTDLNSYLPPKDIEVPNRQYLPSS